MSPRGHLHHLKSVVCISGVCCTCAGGPLMVQLQSTAVWLRALALSRGLSGWGPAVWWWDKAVGLSPILVWAHTATSYTVPAVKFVAGNRQHTLSKWTDMMIGSRIRWSQRPQIPWERHITHKQYLWECPLWQCSSCSPWRVCQTARTEPRCTVWPWRNTGDPSVFFVQLQPEHSPIR